MFDKFEKFFKDKIVIDSKAGRADTEQRLMIATTVLFLEMAYADFEVLPEEEEHIEQTLEQFFKLSRRQITEVIEAAKQSRRERNDIWLFTNLIKETFDRSQKLWILEKLWALIYADGTVDKYEDHLIRKLSNLLGLDHGEMIQAKLNAKKEFNM